MYNVYSFYPPALAGVGVGAVQKYRKLMGVMVGLNIFHANKNFRCHCATLDSFYVIVAK